jgi:ferric citrate transport system permease protein
MIMNPARSVSAPRFGATLVLFVGLVAVLLGAAVISASVGAAAIAPDRVVAALLGSGTTVETRVVVDFRLPRVLLAAMVGSGLAVSGTILQGVTRNPLASPAVVGLNGGAALAAIAVLFLFPAAASGTISQAALLGSLAAGTATYVLSRRDGTIAPIRLALIGLAVGSFALALIQLLIVKFFFLGDYQVALRWLLGSLWARSWEHFQQLLPWSLVLLPAASLLADRLDILLLGEEVPRALGSRLETLRAVALLVAVGLAASAVAVGGAISFVGLLAPHMARKVTGPRHRVLIPAAAMIGAILVLVGDTLGRAVLPPLEIPVGLITAIIGAPYFLWQLRREQRRWSS